MSFEGTINTTSNETQFNEDKWQRTRIIEDMKIASEHNTIQLPPMWETILVESDPLYVNIRSGT